MFDVGEDVRGCGCIGIISDGFIESEEMFQITATVSDESVEITGLTSAIVNITDAV